MGDNKRKWLWISLGIIAGIIVLGYIGTALYFMSHFLPNTKVNGKDFSYAKEEDVADYLKSEVKKSLHRMEEQPRSQVELTVGRSMKRQSMRHFLRTFRMAKQ
nr:hypothetical protein [uncultured Mediterraneibacter sp.]